MKQIRILLVIALLLAPTSLSAAAGGKAANTVILTADMVTSAVDIEFAINLATNYGTRPGAVVLDGREGPFVYAPEAEDVDVNIFVSDLSLRGINHARLHGGAITMDAMDLHNILIEGLEMHCPAECISSPDGMHENVTIRDNRLFSGNFAIDVSNTDGWLIENNQITAEKVAIHLFFASGIRVFKNHGEGEMAVWLESSHDCQISNNKLSAEHVGVLLGGSSQSNQVVANQIRGVDEVGIVLDLGTSGNKVHANQVTCAPDAPTCLVVYDEGTDNQVQGNR